MQAHTVAILSILLVTACSSDDTTEPTAGSDPAALACSKVAEPGAAVTPGADRASAPVISPGDAPVTVTLSPSAEGYLRIDGPEDLLLFSELSGVVTGLFQDQETSDMLPQKSPNSDCPTDILEHYDLELESAGPWYVRVGPSTVDKAWLMLTEASGHGH